MIQTFLTSAILAICFQSIESINIHEEWQPVLNPDLFDNGKSLTNIVSGVPETVANNEANNECQLYKVGFIQDLYFQYIQYKINIPELKEFTLCFWSRFSNHSNDHPIFSYAVDGQAKTISSSISNTNQSSYFTLAVEGHTFFRLNYPLRLNRWYHTCQSWNGKTGEWQIWVNAERVGRGFHNRLVDAVIPGGGIAITGQQQNQHGGGFVEDDNSFIKGGGGMLGEITMLQLYSVALTAGKAHKDHKHHHAHQFDHDGNRITTPPTTTPTVNNQQPSHPLLTAGQLNRMVRLNFGGQSKDQLPQVVQGQNYNAQFLNGQFSSGLVTQQLTKENGVQTNIGVLPQQISSTSGLVHSSLLNPGNVQIIDSTSGIHQLFKREGIDNHPKDKRQAIFNGVVDQLSFEESLLYGLAGIGDNQPILQQQKEEDEREPAEAEVKAVMNICSGCDEEPFGKALILGWRTVTKKIFSGAFYVSAVPQCRVF